MVLVRRYYKFYYKAKSWKYPQRVIVKIEVSSMGTNIRRTLYRLMQVINHRDEGEPVFIEIE